MKIGICGDVHWSQYSSIVRKRGEKYSVRLENLIQSMNWFSSLVSDNDCFAAFFLGDFFDKPELNAEEISALQEVKWPCMSTYFLCGNHEQMSVNHEYSSAKVFDLLDTGEVIYKPEVIRFKNVEILALPYILEANRQPIISYFNSERDSNTYRILLSHNDIKGIQMGQFLSDTGFEIPELEGIADVVINGHLHNGAKVSDKIINIGIISGQNFSEDASKYEHCAFIIDTDTRKIDVYENPYALNFYKLDWSKSTSYQVSNLKNNAVVTVKAHEKDFEVAKETIKNTKQIIESRVILEADTVSDSDSEITYESLSVDHLSEFKKYVLENIGSSEIVIEELNKICK